MDYRELRTRVSPPLIFDFSLHARRTKKKGNARTLCSSRKPLDSRGLRAFTVLWLTSHLMSPADSTTVLRWTTRNKWCSGYARRLGIAWSGCDGRDRARVDRECSGRTGRPLGPPAPEGKKGERESLVSTSPLAKKERVGSKVTVELSFPCT